MTTDNDLKIKLQYEWAQIKKTGYQNNKVYIKEIAPKGLGVFAKEDIKAGEVVEMCHTVIAETPSKYMHDKNLSEYTLPAIIKDDMYPSFLFGFGCMYNSSETQIGRNIDWIVIPESRLSVYIAKRNIKRDEELVTWFGEGFYTSRCKPNIDNYIKSNFHKQIDEKLSMVRMPNSKNNILEDNLTKLLSLDVIENNNCDIKLIIQNISENTNEIIKKDCIKYLTEIKGLRNIDIIFE